MKQSGIDWIGEIPDDWKINQLSQIVSQVKNKNTGLKENNLLSLSYGKIKRKNINTNDGLLPASFDGYNIISDGDIVLRLTDLQNDHTSLRVGRATEQGIITSAYTTLHPVDYDNSKYLYYILHSFDLKKGFYGMGSGVRQGLNYDEVKTIKVPLPPKATQQRIAEYLDSKCAQIDSIIEESKKSIEEYKAWKQSVIFEAVTGKNLDCKKKDSGIEWIGEIPEGWEIRQIRNVILRGKNGIKIGPFGSTLTNKTEANYPYNIYGQANLVSNDFSFTKNTVSKQVFEELKNYEVIAGDICLSMMGTIGKCRTVPKGIKQGIIDSHLIKIRLDAKIITNSYFEYVYDKDYSGLCYQQMQHDKKGSIMDGLNTTIVKSLLIPLPSITEQETIAKMLDSKCAQIDSLIAEKELLITDLTEYKKSLIFEVVTGKRSV